MITEPRKIERIVKMLVDGWSLDRICEWGVRSGWKRSDVLEVIKAKGWALDWEGRLQGRYRGQQAIEAVAYRASMNDAEIERLIQVGTDHPEVEIRRAAIKAQRYVDELRRVLVIQEVKDVEEVARRRRARDAEQPDPNWTETDLRPIIEQQKRELLKLKIAW